VSPEMVELVLKTKPRDKIIFISDALPLAHYGQDCLEFAGEKICKSTNYAISSNGIIAGSTMLLSETYPNLKEKINLKFADFITFASANPARLLNLTDEFTIKTGSSPTLALWDFTNGKLKIENGKLFQ